ncbi:MAG: hypothetical protein C0392_11960, partial [Syntrophus sp. (in: bacteria)]|nr:hypothetical protein [Syntrophus sp. (in: bacteria)]
PCDGGGDKEVNNEAERKSKDQTGHFYFGKNRTFLLWLDNRSLSSLTFFPIYYNFSVSIYYIGKTEGVGNVQFK